jgi:hypothetical protein
MPTSSGDYGGPAAPVPDPPTLMAHVFLAALAGCACITCHIAVGSKRRVAERWLGARAWYSVRRIRPYERHR